MRQLDDFEVEHAAAVIEGLATRDEQLVALARVFTRCTVRDLNEIIAAVEKRSNTQ